MTCIDRPTHIHLKVHRMLPQRAVKREMYRCRASELPETQLTIFNAENEWRSNSWRSHTILVSPWPPHTETSEPTLRR